MALQSCGRVQRALGCPVNSKRLRVGDPTNRPGEQERSFDAIEARARIVGSNMLYKTLFDQPWTGVCVSQMREDLAAGPLITVMMISL